MKYKFGFMDGIKLVCKELAKTQEVYVAHGPYGCCHVNNEGQSHRSSHSFVMTEKRPKQTLCHRGNVYVDCLNYVKIKIEHFYRLHNSM
jgi:hypothetical protein